MAKRKTITEQLRAAILKAEAKGMTRGEIARAAGFTVTGITKIIDGGGVSVDKAEPLASALGYKLKLTPAG